MILRIELSTEGGRGTWGTEVDIRHGVVWVGRGGKVRRGRGRVRGRGGTQREESCGLGTLQFGFLGILSIILE